MVKDKIKDYTSLIKKEYKEALGFNISLLVAGGSVGRGNFVHGWSDVDLLLVLEDINADNLKKVLRCEDKLSLRLGTDIDTMIISKNTFEEVSPCKLHGKVKNFIFFYDSTKTLICKDVKIPKISFNDFVYGFWATFSEQEKKFLRRNTDIDVGNIKDLKKLLKKNIKIIFLLLKQFYARPELFPSTYHEVIDVLPNNFFTKGKDKLLQYIKYREKNYIEQMNKKDLLSEIKESVVLFVDISKHITKSL